MPTFKLTDGRPWFKQVISGILLAIIGTVVVSFVSACLIVGAIVILVFLHSAAEAGMGTVLLNCGKFLLAAAGTVAALLGVGWVWLWATDALDDDDY